MDQHQLDIVRAHPLGAHLDAVRASLYEIAPTPADIDAIGSEELQNLCLNLLSTLCNLPAIRQLPSASGIGNLRQDLLKLTSAVASNAVNYGQVKPLLDAVLTRRSDVEIWEQVYHAVTESTPPPQTPVSSSLQTSSVCVNMDRILRDELGVMYVDVPNFYEAFFGHITSLEIASTEIFQNFTDEKPPLFQEGCWAGWPENANHNNVLAWLADLCGQITARAQDYTPRTMRRRPLVRPNNPLDGSVAKRKPGFAFVDGPAADYDWSHILIPGELKSNPKEDTESQARLDAGRYAREVFTAQPTRRFVLAFTLCGRWMRLWEFDRLGGIASTRFDVHQEGRLFVSIILGFLWMDDKSLGFDPTVIKSENQQYINIERDGTTERLIIDSLIRRTPGVVGRAATCWKAYPDGDKTKPLVIKDSWQFPEREDEGELLKRATEQEVKNVARYYSHATVCVGDDDDDVQGNIRKGLNVAKASNYGQVRLLRSFQSQASSTGSKRSAGQVGAPLPPSKRSRSGSMSPIKPGNQPLPNRIHRRIILRDYGKPIYKASSRPALLKALVGCIKGHKSLYQAGFLHRDISINNLMINEDDKNPSWPSFLIDLDLAIKIDRQKASGAKEKTGTRAFMAIGVLSGDHHSFMDDLESFYWVLLWICIHYDGAGQGRRVAMFDEWNSVDTEVLLQWKQGTLSKKIFNETVLTHFTMHYRALAPWVGKLRDAVFPNGESWEKEDVTLYSRMIDILNEAQHDSSVAAGRLISLVS
ncbi:putative serine threonine-protein kinase Sgk2 [Rosellinia necatrix]|uniref:non-specific serine/threonine protein kinase n=1 Tax=Rosellinia necatrix TaxID=77044 RepID=A0A1W2TER1_ROSNE|nr:putative serine threonine-protein kinase Sgk2 [Rosellinia necatrix]